MFKNKPVALHYLAALMLALTLSACEFSTASIGTVSASKQKGGPATTEFGDTDTLFVNAETKGVSDGVKFKWKLYATKVEGVPPNQQLNETDLDMASGTNSVDYSLSTPEKGWPPGTYKVEATLFLEGGKQQEQKSIDITIKES
jgi:hypothetical protein